MDWLPPPDVLSLTAGDVHVWRMDLDAVLPADARATLGADEEARAGQFRFAHLTRRFVAARVTLRAILSGYTGIPAVDLDFTYSVRGKPALARSTPERPIAFNVSHSDEFGLCAVTGGRLVGVDIERRREGRDPFDPLDRYFSAVECATLVALDPQPRREASYVCWTRKEAFLKARGDGLSLALDAFDVTCAPGDSPRILAVRDAAADGRRWTTLDVAPIEGCAAAVVVEGVDPRRSHWKWTWPVALGD